MIRAIQHVAMPELPGLGGAGKPAGGTGFGEAMRDAVNSVSASRAESANKTERFLSGEGEEVHEVVLSQQKAMLEFELFMQMRNKVVQAYQELMRMPL